jgi:hypothetical protein
MPSNKLLIGVVAALILAGGAGYIVYAGRPVMKVTPAVAGTPTGTTPAADTSKTYTMADVQAHNTQSNCWSAIGGDVYDLTSWVSRHPGGAQSIIGLCGTDGTSAYTNQHGSSRRPKSVLALLKIGSLK